MYASVLGALMFSAAAFGISAAVDSPRTLMSRGDYAAARSTIASESRTALTRCRAVQGAMRDLCKAEAHAAERVKKADLDARYHGTVNAAAEAKLVRAKAHYDIAKVKCGAISGDGKVECLQSARADKARAIADAKLASL